jgi:hypothetical protein
MNVLEPSVHLLVYSSKVEIELEMIVLMLFMINLTCPQVL